MFCRIRNSVFVGGWQHGRISESASRLFSWHHLTILFCICIFSSSALAQQTKEYVYLNGRLLAIEPLPTYLVGDGFPVGSDAAGGFGDGALNNLDLIYTLRAMTNVPGYRPSSCTDRFDSMDSFPADSGATRGGDGVLNNFDLIETLRRVTNIDTSRPSRASRGGVCASGPSVPLQVFSRAESSVAEPYALLEFGDPQITATTRNIPVFLRTGVALTGLSVGLGAQASGLQFQFSSANGGISPTVVDSTLPGGLALAWLNPLPASLEQRTFLGNVQLPKNGNSTGVVVYGVQADDAEGHRVRLSVTGLPMLSAEPLQ